MNRIFNPKFHDKRQFSKSLIEFAEANKNCFSVKEKKKYIVVQQNSSIIMTGEDRKNPAIYSIDLLETIYENLKNEENLTTRSFAPYVGRDRSPLLALLTASDSIINSTIQS